jgi:phosphatidylserine decarboxylase
MAAMRRQRRGPFFPAYRLLPHRLINGVVGRLARARRPRALVRAVIRACIAHVRVDLSDFEPGPFDSVGALFVRRLRPGARPLGPGVVSPVDGVVVDAGALTSRAVLRVKGRAVPVERLVGGEVSATLEGGAYVVVFLPPGGYHRVHMPDDGAIVGCRRVRGRFFPLSDDESRNVDGAYVRNERAVVRCRLDRGGELWLVLVGASLVGGIHLEGVLARRKGDEVGHFAFGSTVIVLTERGDVALVAAGARVRMGEPLISPAARAPATAAPLAGSGSPGAALPP